MSFQGQVPNVQLKPIEQQYYYKLFSMADQNNVGFIKGKAVRNLFPRSGLPKKTLALVWTLADRSKKNILSREDFCIALRLIAIAQRGIQISHQALQQHQDVPLPVFQGIDRPQAPPASSPQPAAAVSPAPSGKWQMGPQERTGYLNYFTQADEDRDGFVSGAEARKFFKMSNLSASQLRQIWDLSDVDKDHRLSKDEFCIAMHLVMKVRMNKWTIPSSLPAELQPGRSSKPDVTNNLLGSLPSLGPDTNNAPDLLGSLGNGSDPPVSLDMSSPSPPPAQPSPQPPQPSPYMSGSGDILGPSPAGFVAQQPPRQPNPNAGSKPSVPPRVSSFNRPGPGYGGPASAEVEKLRQQAFAEAKKQETMANELNQVLSSQETATAQTKALKAQVDKFSREQLRLKERINFAESQLQMLSEQKQEYESLLQDKQEQFDLEQKKRNDLERKLEQEQLSLDDKQRQIDAKNREIEQMRRQQTEMQAMIESQKEQGSEKDMELVMLEQQITSLKQALKQVEDLQTNQADIANTLSSRESDLRQEKDDLTELLASARKELSGLRERTQQQKATNSALETEVSSMRSDLQSLQDEIQVVKSSAPAEPVPVNLPPKPKPKPAPAKPAVIKPSVSDDDFPTFDADADDDFPTFSGDANTTVGETDDWDTVEDDPPSQAKSQPGADPFADPMSTNTAPPDPFGSASDPFGNDGDEEFPAFGFDDDKPTPAAKPALPEKPKPKPNPKPKPKEKPLPVPPPKPKKETPAADFDADFGDAGFGDDFGDDDFADMGAPPAKLEIETKKPPALPPKSPRSPLPPQLPPKPAKKPSSPQAATTEPTFDDNPFGDDDGDFDATFDDADDPFADTPSNKVSADADPFGDTPSNDGWDADFSAEFK